MPGSQTMDTPSDWVEPQDDDPLLSTHAAFGLKQVQTFSQGTYTLPHSTQHGLSTAASPTFPFSYSPRRPSFLVADGPSSSPGYGTVVTAPLTPTAAAAAGTALATAAASVSASTSASTTATAATGRARSGSIGFLSRASVPHQALNSPRRTMMTHGAALPAPTSAERLHAHTSRPPPPSPPRKPGHDAAPTSAARRPESDCSSPSPQHPSTPSPSVGPPDMAARRQQDFSEGHASRASPDDSKSCTRPRDAAPMPAADNDSVKAPRDGVRPSPKRRLSFPGASDQVSSCYTLAQLTSGSSRTTLPPISTLFPDLHRTSAPLSAALPYAPWHDDILSLAHPGPFQRHQQHPPSHQQDKEEYTASRQPSLGEAQSRFAQRRIYNARHTTAGHRFPEPSNSRTSMKPDEGLASTRVRLSVRSSSDLSDLSDDSSRSEPSPAAPRSCSGGPNRTTQTRVTRADSTVRSAMPPPRPGEPAIGDLKRYTFPATRNLHVGQMFRSTKPAAPASAAASKSARPRAGSMMSPEPAERPQIKRSLSWQAQRDVKAESPALEADHPSARRSSSPLSEFDAEDAAGHGDESHQTATRRMRSFDASSHCPVGDSESLLDSTEWDMRSKHGRVLTRRSKVIVNDTDRRRPGYIRPIEEDRKRVRTLLDALLRAAPGNGKHLTARFPYEPKTRTAQLVKMGLRLVWSSAAQFSEAELASSTRRFRKEQCERLISTIEAGHVRFEPIDSGIEMSSPAEEAYNAPQKRQRPVDSEGEEEPPRQRTRH